MAGQFYLQQAAHVLRDGGLIAYPTEAVYGLGCNPSDQQAVERLLALKQRPMHKGLILLGSSLEQLEPWVELTTTEKQQLSESWPLATTYLVKASPKTPHWIRGKHPKVAVRVSQHPIARQLALLADTPLVSTSANLSGRPSLKNAYQVSHQLGGELDFLVTGQCNLSSKPSTIIDLESGQVLRG